MIKSLNAILIQTANLDKMVSFYQTLGVPLKVSNHGGGLHAECDFGPVHFSLQHTTLTSGPSSAIEFSFEIENLEEVCKSLSAKGVSFTQPPEPHPFGGVKAHLHDPDGNQVILMRWMSKDEYNSIFKK